MAQNEKKTFITKKKLLSTQIKVFFFVFNLRDKFGQKRRKSVSRIWDFWDLLKIEKITSI